ncbi:MAG: hypothetical protein AAF747_12200, partial [Planctomycetota bacterium]
VPMEAINGDLNRVGWISFSIGARAADFNFDGVVDADDVLDFLNAFDSGIGDFNADDALDYFDIADLLRAIGNN